MTLKEKTKIIKEIGFRLGFDKIGIAPAEKLPHASYLTRWLSEGRHGTMQWMENYLDKRLDIRKLYPPAQSVIVVAKNYYTPFKHSSDPNKGKISRYAWGKDYHKILKKSLKRFLSALREMDSTLDGRLFVDTGPVQEKLWAARAGIGWQGKNTNIITRDFGSWLFLGVLIINQPLEYDRPLPDYCGSCNACVQACPTNALQPYRLDASKCISYLTIEYWDRPIPETLADKMENWVFGCDICQDVCPWNRFAQTTEEQDFFPLDPRFVQPELEWLADLSEEEFKRLFKKTPVIRAKFANFKRNVLTILRRRWPHPPK
jgi:epoxyqueuosine reductase